MPRGPAASNPDEEPTPHANNFFTNLGTFTGISTAVTSTVALGFRSIIVGIGTFAILAGSFWLIRRQGQPVGRWTILPVVIVAAGTGASAAALASSSTSNQRVTAGSSTERNNGGGADGADGSRQTQRSDEAPVSREPSRPKSAYTLTLFDPKRVGSTETYYKEGPLNIDTATYERVLYNTPDCDYEGPVFEIYQTDRKYRKFQAKVGVGDNTPHEARVEFTVLADGVVRHSEIAVLGQQPVPFEADIADAFRIQISTQVLITENCKGKVYGAWIDPVIVP